jgi:hypothetical protein
MKQRSGSVHVGTASVLALLLGVLASPPAARAGADIEAGGLGQIVALTGDVFAESTAARSRRLVCHDRIEAGETLTTSPGAQVALLIRDIYAKVGGGSTLWIGTTEEGALSFRLWGGQARMVDTRRAGDVAPFHLVTPHLETHALHSDTEVWVVSQNGGTHSRICERVGSLQVVRSSTGEEMATGAGDCTVGVPGSGLRFESAAPQGLSVSAGPSCDSDDVVGALASHFTPGDVAAPPIALPSFRPPHEEPGLSRDPCHEPGPPCEVVGLGAVRFGEPPGLGGGGFPGSSSFGEPAGLGAGAFPGAGGD